MHPLLYGTYFKVVNMINLKEFSIPFSVLNQGKHRFEYTIKNTFLKSFGYDEFNEAKINIEVILNVMSTIMELEIVSRGVVNIDCDLTSESYDQNVNSSTELIVKFGDEYNDEDDGILIIPHRKNQINVAQYIYEMLVFAIPIKRVHPGVLDGTLESVTLEKLEELRVKETRENKEESDPRWDVLKKLITNK